MELIRYNEYSRKDICNIFSPGTIFTPGSGYWGISGIIKIPQTSKDYIFLVTYGQKQAEHEFDEHINENGILTWQSQPSQTLSTPQIQALIKHNYMTDNIHLFLRTNKNNDYTYLGLLAYISHDNQREQPVYFKWQILDWDQNSSIPLTNSKMVRTYSTSTIETIEKNFTLLLNEDTKMYYKDNLRKGSSTKDFFSNKNIDFEGEIKKNTTLGNKGEDIVVEYEKYILISSGREDLAKKVITTRELKGNAERFDILSYETDGTEKYIEVKTTKGGLYNRFYISENEVSFSQQYPNNYYLYRIYNFDINTMSADLKIVKGPIERTKLEPTNYTCRIG